MLIVVAVVYAQAWLDAVPDQLEIFLWALIGMSAAIAAVRVIWGWGPVWWLRENIAEDIENRVKRVNEDANDEQFKKVKAANEEQFEKVKALVDQKIEPLQSSINEVITLAKATDRDLKQHMVDSADQHAADLKEREARQVERDKRDEGVDELIDKILTRLTALEPTG